MEFVTDNSRLYDQRRKVIPCFDDLYGYPLGYLTLDGAQPSVLDAGAGSGVFTDFLLQRFPKAQATLIDLSKDQLEAARQRLRPHHVHCIQGSYLDYPFASQFDAVITALSLHHLDTAGKKAFFRRAYEWLKPGGQLLVVDIVRNASEHINDHNIRLWHESMRNAGLTQGEIDRTRHNMRHDEPVTVTQQLNWMQSAGLRDADCVYRYGRYAALYGYKMKNR